MNTKKQEVIKKKLQRKVRKNSMVANETKNRIKNAKRLHTFEFIVRKIKRQELTGSEAISSIYRACDRITSLHKKKIAKLKSRYRKIINEASAS